MQPLNVRNQNPGNMRPVGSSTGFQTFSSPQEGLEAMRRDLMAKITGKSKAMGGKEPTLSNVISTWAPPSENDTKSYIDFVAKKTGLSPDAVLTEADLDSLIPAMIEKEGGKEAAQYYGSQTLSMAQMSPEDDALLNAFGMGGTSEEVPVSNPQDPTAMMSDDDLLSVFTGGPIAPVEKPIEFSDAPEDVNAPSMLESASAGAFRGFQDIGDTLAPVLAKGALEASELFGGDEAPSFQDLRESQKSTTRNDLAMYDDRYGDSGTATAGRVAGNIVATALPVNKLAQGLQVAGRAVGPVGKFLTGQIESNRILDPLGKVIQGSTLGNKLLQAGSQGTFGAGMGAASVLPMVGGNPDMPVADQLKVAAATGGAIGAMTPALTRGIELAGDAKNALMNMRKSPAEQAQNKLVEAMIRDGVPVEEIPARLEAMGPEATLMDVGGANTVGLGRAVATTPGQGKEAITQMLDARQEGQIDRLTSAALKGLGVSDDATYQGALDGLIEQRSTSAAPLYDEAFKGNKNVSSKVVDKILNTEAGKKALSFAAKRMNNDMALMGVPDKELAEQARLVGQYPKGGVASGLKLRTLDLVKQGLDDQYEALARAGEKGAARSINDLRKGLLKELDAIDLKATGGKYAEARSAYSGPSQSMDALEAGKSFIKNSETNAKAIDSMAEQDKAFFRIGVAQKIRETLNNTPDAADAVKKIFGSRAKRQALESVFPSKEAFDDFARQVETEAKFFENASKIGRQSATMDKALEVMDAGMPINLDSALKGAGAAMGDTSAALSLGKDFLVNKLMPKKTMNPKLAESLGNLLVSSDPKIAGSLVRQPVSRENRLLAYMDALARNIMPAAPAASVVTNRFYGPQETY